MEQGNHDRPTKGRAGQVTREDTLPMRFAFAYCHLLQKKEDKCDEGDSVYTCRWARKTDIRAI